MTQAKYASIDKVVPDSVQALMHSDKKLKPWIEKIGALALPKRQAFELVDALARSILFQQLHGKAAQTIVRRLEALAGETVFSAGALARLSAAEYRGVGVSSNKAKALHSLADVAFSGGLPGPRQLAKLDNSELIKMLTPIQGVGTWTVQMLLIFRMGRGDVWPVDDFGVRKGVQIAHKMAEMPTPKELLVLSEKLWTPHLSLAALYFWRIADMGKLSNATKEPAVVEVERAKVAKTAKIVKVVKTAKEPVLVIKPAASIKSAALPIRSNTTAKTTLMSAKAALAVKSALLVKPSKPVFLVKPVLKKPAVTKKASAKKSPAKKTLAKKPPAKKRARAL